MFFPKFGGMKKILVYDNEVNCFLTHRLPCGLK